MAQHYRDRSRYVYYEVLNEPHGIADALWNSIQQKVVDAIRTVDQTHTIIIGPAGWNSYNNLKYMPEYRDPNLIYTFHFYDPFLFTHQGASWTSPSMVSLAGVPFPYDATAMPTCPNDLEGTWVEGALNTSYKTEGTVARVKELIDRAVSFRGQRRFPVQLLCGEFGVYMPNSDPGQRVNWYRLVREYLEEKGIAWTTWDYTGGFGLFETGGNDLFEHDLNIPLLEALDFNVPAADRVHSQARFAGIRPVHGLRGPPRGGVKWGRGRHARLLLRRRSGPGTVLHLLDGIRPIQSNRFQLQT